MADQPLKRSVFISEGGQEDDFVLVQNKEEGEIACREVASPYANPGAIILVTLESVDGETEVIEATDNHPL